MISVFCDEVVAVIISATQLAPWLGEPPSKDQRFYMPNTQNRVSLPRNYVFGRIRRRTIPAATLGSQKEVHHDEVFTHEEVDPASS